MNTNLLIMLIGKNIQFSKIVTSTVMRLAKTLLAYLKKCSLRLAELLLLVTYDDTWGIFNPIKISPQRKDEDTKFSAPGANYRARWMSKEFYTLKIFEFYYQLHITKLEMDSLLRICIFNNLRVLLVCSTFDNNGF